LDNSSKSGIIAAYDCLKGRFSQTAPLPIFFRKMAVLHKGCRVSNLVICYA
jgi:hypothetical protein